MSPSLTTWLPRYALALALSALLHGAVIVALCGVPVPRPASPRPVLPAPRQDWDFGLEGGGGTATFTLTRGPAGELRTSQARRPLPGPAAVPADEPFEPTIVLAPPEAPDPRSAAGGQPTERSEGGNWTGEVSGAGPGGGAGRGAATTFFNLTTRADRIVYVLDRSSSMGQHGAWRLACREVLASLDALPETALVQVIVYNTNAAFLLPHRPGWLPATAANRGAIASALLDLPTEGGTHHHLALPLALSLAPDAVFFLTDAAGLTRQYLSHVSRLNRSGAAIHVVELNTHPMPRRDSPLPAFASSNGGRHAAVDLFGR